MLKHDLFTYVFNIDKLKHVMNKIFIIHVMMLLQRNSSQLKCYFNFLIISGLSILFYICESLEIYKPASMFVYCM